MKSTTPRTFTFSLFATKALLYLCLALLQQATGVSAASAKAAAAVANEPPPRRGSHISTGFVKPALLLVPTSASMAQNGVGRRREGGGRNMMNVNASRNVGAGEGQENGKHVSYDLMNGMFDNECMQRHMNTGRQGKQ